jgi:poly-beta-1,6-N-acetyl-D-glucosamine synthase
MLVLLVIISIIAVLYFILMIYYWVSWTKIPLYHASPTGGEKISVIIPCRNEEENIVNLLNALKQQTFPEELFEVIVVDDHSTDRTAELVIKFEKAILVRLEEDNINSYKKKAIETGVRIASGEIIVTTDADCIPDPKWLQTIAAFKNDKNAAFIAAPVQYNIDSSMLQIFQSLDFMMMQGITGASVDNKKHSICNGANLAYEKNAFFEVGGFSGIDAIASGDDMLLMQKIWKRYPDRIHYLKSRDAIVNTFPSRTWKEFFHQRVRWASKATVYDDKSIFAVLLIVYLFNLSFLSLFILAFWYSPYWIILFGLIVAKYFFELPLLLSVTSFFKQKSILKYFFILQPLHILYIIVAGWLGQFGSYEWKGRKVR